MFYDVYADFAMFVYHLKPHNTSRLRHFPWRSPPRILWQLGTAMFDHVVSIPVHANAHDDMFLFIFIWLVV